VFKLDLGGGMFFTADGRSSELILDVLSFQENTIRWSEGLRSYVLFTIEDCSSKYVHLRLNTSDYLDGRLQHQNVVLIVNVSQVAGWQVAGGNNYEARIPSKLIGEDGLVNLVFDISNQRVPFDNGELSDFRKLSIAVRELVVDYAE
jgi:hypothetical protein